MLTAYLYKKDKTLETNVTRAAMLAALQEKDSLLWVDLEEPNDFEIECLVEIFNFHPLAVEDCLTDIPQPKVDDYDEYLFLVMHAFLVDSSDPEGIADLKAMELDIFCGRNYVVTFHKHPGKTIGQVREAILKKPERYMGNGSDMLVHAILDRLVDNYQPILDHYDHEIDHLEDEMFNRPAADYLSVVMKIKKDVYQLRRVISPQQELLNNLTRGSTAFIRPKHLIYFRDVYDHLFRIYGAVEGFHEALSSLLQAYFSYNSYKLNDVVKHLTVLATIAMPPVIIASFYGMNFRHMPELDWKFGYPLSILLSVLLSVAMLVWMKFKKWI